MSVAGDDPLARVRLLLREVPQLDTRVHAATRQPPAEGSPAAADQDRFDGIGSYPWVFAGQVLGVAMDHAEAWVRLFESHGLPQYAHLTLLRATLEAAVTVRWLISAVTPEGRVAAAVSMLEEDLVDWDRLVDSFPGSADPDDTAVHAKVLGEIRAQVAVAGFQTKRPPSTSDRVRDFGVHPGPKTDWIFRILSAPAHGSTWSISLGEVGDEVEPLVRGARTVKVRAHPLLASNATSIVVSTLVAAVTDFERYAGRPRPST
jgi:hypothetical protein